MPGRIMQPQGKMIGRLLPVTAAVLGILSLGFWYSLPPAVDLEPRIPGMDGTDGTAAPGAEAWERPEMIVYYEAFDGVPSNLTGSWPRFRGADTRNVAPSGAGLSENWGEEGPPVLWSLDLGDGHAGAAVARGRVYILDYYEERKADALRCFSLDDGREIWRQWYVAKIKRNHGISRTVPTVTDRYVVTVGPKCHVLCVDADTGGLRWTLDLVREYGTGVPLWNTAQCPLVDGTTAVLAPGGTALMVGVDCETGTVLWETPNPDGWQMSHASIVPMEFKGRKMYVYAAIGGIVGVSAGEDDAGTVLWKTAEWNHSVVAPSPVILEDGRIFVTAGYGAGSMMLQLSENGGEFSIAPLFSLEKTVFACEQQTPIYHRGHLFTILPNDAGALKREVACLRPDGRPAWTSGKKHRFGLGPFLVVGDRIFILNDDGVLTLIEANPERYVQIAQTKVLDGRDAWAPMAFADGRLLLRDSKRMVCLDVGLQ